MPRFEISRDFYAETCIHVDSKSQRVRCMCCTAAISAWCTYVRENSNWIWKRKNKPSLRLLDYCGPPRQKLPYADWPRLFYDHGSNEIISAWVRIYNLGQLRMRHAEEELDQMIVKKAEAIAVKAARSDYQEWLLKALPRRLSWTLSRSRLAYGEDKPRSLWILIIPDRPWIDCIKLGRKLRAISTSLVFQKERKRLHGVIPIVWRARVCLRKPMRYNELRDLLEKPGNFGYRFGGAGLSIDLAGMSTVNPIHRGFHMLKYPLQRKLRRDMPISERLLDGPWCETRRTLFRSEELELGSQ
jgi:hypothetical protein